MLTFIYNLVKLFVNSQFFTFWFPYIFAFMALILIVHIIRRIINV